jgi:hypothetical protein
MLKEKPPSQKKFPACLPLSPDDDDDDAGAP